MSDARYTIGSDTVSLQGMTVVIEAACEMPEWRATRYRRTAVRIGAHTYFVSSKDRRPGGACRYVLEPWPEDHHDMPGNVVQYDPVYVKERDLRRREQARREKEAFGLWVVRLLLGFLPSGVKHRLNERYGFHPLTVTEQSLFIQRFVLIGLMGLFMIHMFTGVLGAKGLPLLGGIALIGVDLVVRTGQALTASLDQYGFGEWIVRRYKPRF
jgi:hypothetical protein